MTSTKFVLAWIKAHCRTDRGAALVEYAFLLVLVFVVCLAAVAYLGTATSSSTTHSANEVMAAN
jgi:pilus assembly protein Flp/PilA